MQDRTLWIAALLCAGCATVTLGEIAPEPEGVSARTERYIAAWKHFYPSRAVARGFVGELDDFETRSAPAIEAWIDLNRRELAALDALLASTDLALDDRLDLGRLRTQARTELDVWRRDRPHERSPELYSRLLAGAVEPLVGSPLLSADAKRRLLPARLTGMTELARVGRTTLVDGSRAEIVRAVEQLRSAAAALPGQLATFDAGDAAAEATLAARIRHAIEALTDLAEWLESHLLARASLDDDPILGRDAYAAKLAIYTDSELTPERLEALALDEIEAAKRDLADLARAYWRHRYPDEPQPATEREAIARAFRDLEANRPVAEQPYLERLRQYGRDVEAFVRDYEIATVPEHNTLGIELAPESAGPMARIGYVSSAPPFHPNPWTTWYLATIPDSHPEQERIDFWRSFNYSFKRFIVIHELFPGHYMQLKLLRENPHRGRILFPYRPFIEGWATFTERIVLDAGYAPGDWLTRLAQLRKRLENANRAYTSVQAHCRGWTESQVFEFSVNTSLLAPQFAKSLWGRLMRSPMQILTYMLMGLELRDLYGREQARLGERFVLRDFMDTILRTGPVPTRDLEAVLHAAHR